MPKEERLQAGWLPSALALRTAAWHAADASSPPTICPVLHGNAGCQACDWSGCDRQLSHLQAALQQQPSRKLLGDTTSARLFAVGDSGSGTCRLGHRMHAPWLMVPAGCW